MKTVYLFLFACLSIIIPRVSFAQTSWKGTVSTSWTNILNWTAGVPTATIDAIIGDANFTGSNQPTISSTANCKSLTLGGTKASTLTISSSTTVAVNIQINGNGTITHSASSLTVKGNWINNGTYSATGTGSTVIFAGTVQSLQGSVVTAFRKLTINAGSVTTLSTNVTVTGTSSRTTIKGTLDPNETPTYKLTGTTFNVNTNAIIKVKGALFTDNYSNSGTVTLSSNSTVNYAATTVNQTISNSYTYSTLIISGAGTKSLSANLTALRSTATSNGNITVSSGTLDLGSFTANRGTSTIGGSFTVASGAFLKIGGTNTFPANYSTVTLNLTSTVEYNGTNQAVSARTYGNLVLSSSSGAATKTMPATAFVIGKDFTSNVGAGTSVSYTAASNITVSGNINIGAATTFNGASYTHNIAGNWTNNGTFTGTTSTINMTGGGSAISGTGVHNFYNLVIAGSNITAAATSSIAVSGDLTTSNPGIFTHLPGGTLTMSGTAKTISGTGITLDNLTVTGTVTSSSSILITGSISVSGSFTSGSPGNILMNGTAKTIGGGGTILFNSLQVSGTVTASSGFSISQSLDVSGAFSATAGTATFTGTSTLNGTANLFNVTINGTSLILSASSVLGIANTFTITAGSLNVSSNKPNTVIFNGTGAQTVNAITYHHLTLANGNTKTAAAGTTVNGNLTINTSTTFSAGSYTHTLLGNWINNGVFTAGTSTVQMTGATNTSITGATTFNILTINKTTSSNVVSLQNNVTVPVINMTTGSVLTGANTLTITTTRNGNGIIMGTITRTHTFSIGVDYAFEGPDNTINFSAVTGVTSITVYVATGNISDYPNGSAINRVYNITVPSGTYVAKLRLHYEDAELNGNDETAMQLIRYNGASWAISGKTGNSATSNYVEQAALTNITNRWTCAATTGVISWNGSVSTDWNNAANWTVVSGTPTAPPSVNDIVQIGASVFTNQPTINSAVSVKSIVMGSAQAAALTIGGSGSLTTSGNISGSWSTGAIHTINAGSQGLTINGDLILSDGTTGHAINLSATSATVSVNGSLIQAGGANISFTGNTSMSIKNDFTYTSGTFSAGTGTVTYNGTASQNIAAVTYNNMVINKATGIALVNAALTVNGNLSVTAGELDLNANATIGGNTTISSGTILYIDGTTINAGGNWSNSGTFTAGAGTVVLNGTGIQTISATTFNNLSINKSAGTATLSGNITINSNLSIQSGTFDLATYTSNRSAAGGQLTISNGATLIAGGANNFPQNFATQTLSNTSTVHYNGTVSQTVAGITYGNLIFSNGGATAKTLSASTTVNGDITLNSGASFNASAYTINLGGNWSNSGTFVPVTSTVVLNGTSKTITGNTIFNRITVYGSYSVAANSDITYNGLLYVTSTGSYAAGGGTATVNGDLTNSGSLTSTGITTFTGTSLQTIRLVNAIASTSTGVVNFNGNVAPVLNSTSTPTFANLNINNTAGVNPSKDWLVMVSMTVGAGGIFNGGISTHTIRGNFTNNGTVTSDGVLYFNPYFPVTLKLSGTSFSSTGTVNFGGTTPVTITGTPASLNDVRITNTNAAGITPPSGWVMNGDFIINSDAIFNAGSYSYTVAGDIESNGTLNGGSSTFTMSSAAGQLTGSPNTIFNHFTITGVISANSDFYVAGNFTNNGTYDGTQAALNMVGGNAASIGGTTTPSSLSQLIIAKSGAAIVTMNVNLSDVALLFIQSGILFTSTYSVTQDGGGGFLLIDNGATLRLGGNNSLPGFSGYGLDPNSNVDYAGATQSIGNAAIYGNLLITAAGNKNAIVPFTTLGNFTLTNGTFTSIVSVTHSIGGNWLMTGGTFNNTNIGIVMNGTANQDISSTGAFKNLTINKSSGVITLSSDVTVNTALNFIAGKISIGNNNLTIGNSGAINNANATNYIIATGNGTLNQQVLAGGSKVFPVGLSSAYTPATIALTAGSVTDIMNVRMLTAPYHGGLSGDVATNYAVNATWLISETVTGGSDASITLQWPLALELPGFNRGLSRLAHYTAGAWEFGTADIPAAGANPYSVIRTGFTDFSPFAVSTYMALPVTWLNINGRNENTDNIINWSVASELNNDHFIIEASADGNNFKAIGKIKGAGTTDIEQRYSFVHRNVTVQVYYYRIKQVDIDGKYSYSKIVKVVADNAGKDKITILNNPVSDKLAISITVAKSAYGSVIISDASGKIVYKEKLKLNTGNNVFEIGVSNYATGMYYVVFVEDSGKKEVVKFIKK
jgi:fibronectin-binding autotransporter adhesin